MSDGMAKAGGIGAFILLLIGAASANAETVVTYLVWGTVALVVIIGAIALLLMKGPGKGIYK